MSTATQRHSKQKRRQHNSLNMRANLARMTAVAADPRDSATPAAVGVTAAVIMV